MPENVASIAFFDVDETLISIKSMFDFYDYFVDAIGHTPDEQRRLHDEARSLLRPGLPRAQGNRLFYRRFAGRKVSEVADIGRQWFDHHLARGGLFHGDVLDALQAHRAAGRMVVLLSGSFPACLDPVAEYCGADLAVCTELEARDGIYTGEVTRSMIGDGKTDAARELLRATGVPPSSCYAYGDHTSDAGLLRLVGHSVLVGANAEMVELATARGWSRLAGTPA